VSLVSRRGDGPGEEDVRAQGDHVGGAVAGLQPRLAPLQDEAEARREVHFREHPEPARHTEQRKPGEP